MNSSASLLVLVCFCAAVGGALPHLLLTPAHRVPEDSGRLDTAGLQTATAILEELRAIRVKLDGPAMSTVSREATAPAAEARDPAKELSAAVERLRDVIAHAPVRLGSAPPPLVVTRATLAPSEVFELVKPLASLDDNEVARRFRFVSSQELLQRYGPPHDLTINGGAQLWEYRTAIERKDGQAFAEIMFRVVDGFVFTAYCNYNE